MSPCHKLFSLNELDCPLKSYDFGLTRAVILPPESLPVGSGIISFSTVRFAELRQNMKARFFPLKLPTTSCRQRSPIEASIVRSVKCPSHDGICPRPKEESTSKSRESPPL